MDWGAKIIIQGTIKQWLIFHGTLKENILVSVLIIGLYSAAIWVSERLYHYANCFRQGLSRTNGFLDNL